MRMVNYTEPDRLIINQRLVLLDHFKPHLVEIDLPKTYTYDGAGTSALPSREEVEVWGMAKDTDKTTVKYNYYITVADVPLELTATWSTVSQHWSG